MTGGLWAGMATALVAALLAAPAAADNQFGSLDPTFGGTGVVLGTSGVGNLTAFTDVTVDGGKIVASGVNGTYRFANNGALDAGFGAGGFIAGAGHSTCCGGQARVRVDRKGRLLRIDSYASPSSGFMTVVQRFLADGTPDPDFASSGRLEIQTAASGATSEPRAVVALPDDSIMVMGNSTNGGPSACTLDIYLMRLTETGGAYPGFGTGGVVHLSPANLPGLSSSPSAACGTIGIDMNLTPDGKLVISGDAIRDLYGSTSLDGMIFRVTKDGVVDGSFGTGGVVEFPQQKAGCPVEVYRAPVDGFGRVVALRVGHEPINCGAAQWAVERFDEHGVLDPSFATYSVSPAVAPSDLILQPNGLPLIGGTETVASSNKRAAVIRLGLDGQPDPTFGDQGTAHVTPAPSASPPFALTQNLAWDPAGYVVVGGAAFNGTTNTTMLFRLFAGVPPTVTISGPDTGVVGTPITLTATPGSTAGVGTPNWDLNGDRVFGDATGTTATFTPRAAGTVRIAAQVTDATGLSGVGTKTLTITAQPAAATTPAATPKATAAKLTLAKTTIKVRKGTATISLACAKPAPCTGTATVAAGKAKIASARYSIKPGKKQNLKLTLSRAFRKKLAKARKLKVTLTLKPLTGAAVKKTLTLTA